MFTMRVCLRLAYFHYDKEQGYAIGDRNSYDSWFLGDRLNCLSVEGFAVCDRYFCESWVRAIASIIYLLKGLLEAIAIPMIRDF